MKLPGFRLFPILACLVCCVLAGCGKRAGESSTASDPQSPGAGNAAKTTQLNGAAPAAGKTVQPPPVVARRRFYVWTDDNGQKFWRGPSGDIPYDVFSGDAIKVAMDNRPVGSPANGTTAKVASPGTKKTAPPPETVAAAGDWKSLVSIAVLETEVKNARNLIQQKMQTLGRYNGSYKLISWHGSSLAAVAAIIERHSDPISWKADAPHVREMGTQIQDAATGLARKNFEATQKPFENLVSLLSRNKPAGLKEARPKIPFSESADRGGLMRRMEIAYNFLQKDANSEQAFKTQVAKVKQEAAILATLAKVIADSSYDSADEDEYKGYANDMVTAALKMAAAADGDEFAEFRKGVDIINNKCTQCHTDYK